MKLDIHATASTAQLVNPFSVVRCSSLRIWVTTVFALFRYAYARGAWLPRGIDVEMLADDLGKILPTSGFTKIGETYTKVTR